MAQFDRDILTIEGREYENDPKDPGGETKFGISKRSYPNIDIKNLTEAQAIAIYTRDFWNKNNLSSIENQETANLIFRFAVNAGNETAVSKLQLCLNTFAPIIEALRVDGDLGSRTLQAIGGLRPMRLQDSFRVVICRHYLNIVLKKPSQEKYFKGWIKRALM